MSMANTMNTGNAMKTMTATTAGEATRPAAHPAGRDGALSAMARWASGFQAQQAPAATLAVARACIADGVGVALAGLHTSVYQACAGLVAAASAAQGPCTLWGRPQMADAPAAAFLNGVALHALDFDDTSYTGIVHGTAVVLPAAWAASELAGASGAVLLDAFICGVEVEYALGLAFSDALYHRGFWTTATLGVIGAAAAAAKALGLDAAQTESAMGNAMATPLGLRAAHGANAKPYIAGMAARTGLEAALAARAGITCPPHMLDHRFGFGQVIGAGMWQADAIAVLGQRFRLNEPGIAFKLHPLCSATQAAIEATLALRREHAIQPADVLRVECRATRLVVDSLPYAAPQTASEAQFSMHFALACALLHGRVGIRELEEDCLHDPALRPLMARVVLREETQAEANTNPPDPLGPEGACVEVTLHNGARYTRRIGWAEGTAERPLSSERAKTKFMACTGGHMTAKEAEALHERLLRMDTRGPVRSVLAP